MTISTVGHCTPSMTRITRTAGESLYQHNQFQHNASSRSRDPEKGHARECRYTLYPTFVSIDGLANWSTTTYQILVQSVRLFLRYGKGACTCRCIPSLVCVNCLANWSLTAHQISAKSAQLFRRYRRGMRTCARADIPHPSSVKRIS